jgi:hypothetical protein
MVVLRKVLTFLAVAVIMKCVATGQGGSGEMEEGQDYYYQGGQDYNYQGVQDYNYPGQGGLQAYQGGYQGLKGRYQGGYQGKKVCDNNIVRLSYANLGQTIIYSPARQYQPKSTPRPVRPMRPPAGPSKPNTPMECERSICNEKEVNEAIHAKAKGNQCRMKWTQRVDT